jgi:hypothetical protein
MTGFLSGHQVTPNSAGFQAAPADRQHAVIEELTSRFSDLFSRAAFIACRSVHILPGDSNHPL